ncbi:MAG: glutathione S-transferase family protein [Gammaproteobacteria bacterium]|nr:glutathione S-transferase family protein [Gammaproteobacteria bacterium]
MIHFYNRPTSPYGQKVRIMLEECGLPYTEIDAGDPAEVPAEDYLAISPTGAVPAIHDTDTGISLFESAAILLYLAEKSSRFLPTDLASRTVVVQWLIFDAATIGTSLLGIYHLSYLGDAVQPAIENYRNDLQSAMELLDTTLEADDWIAGDCSIADFSLFPVMVRAEDFAELPLSRYPSIESWLKRMEQRPGVRRSLLKTSE